MHVSLSESLRHPRLRVCIAHTWMMKPQGFFNGVLQSPQILQRFRIWVFLKPNPNIISEQAWPAIRLYSRVPDLALNLFVYVPMTRELIDEPRHCDRHRVLHKNYVSFYCFHRARGHSPCSLGELR
jgi:hypothetical protein